MEAAYLLGMFHIFEEDCWHSVPCHGLVFRRYLCLCNLQACVRQADVTRIPKSLLPFSTVANSWPISTTPLMSMVLLRLDGVWHWTVLSWTALSWTVYGTQRNATNHIEFAYRNGLGTCDSFLRLHTLQDALEYEQVARTRNSLQWSFFQGQRSANSLQALLCGHWLSCTVCSDTVSLMGHSTSWWMVVRVIW